jgi:hypothetical protein
LQVGHLAVGEMQEMMQDLAVVVLVALELVLVFPLQQEPHIQLL